MNFKRIAVTVALTVMWVAGAAAAQGPRHGRGGRGAGDEFRGLNLTTEQRTQMRSIHEQARAKLTQLDNQPLTRAQYRAQAMEIHKSTHDQIVNNVLTSDQRARVAQRDERRAQMWKNRAERTEHSPAPPAKNQ